MIGRTDLLRVRSNLDVGKAKLLDFSLILQNAQVMRAGVNIVGGSMPQDFNLEARKV